MKDDRYIIDVPDDDDDVIDVVDPRPEAGGAAPKPGDGFRPTISIERETSRGPVVAVGGGRRRTTWWWLAAIVLIAVAAVTAYVYRYDIIGSGIPVSVSDGENLALLRQPYAPSAKTYVAAETDTVLDVEFDMFPLSGLRASLEWTMPDPADPSLMLFCRSADYRADSTVMGSVAVDGEVTADRIIRRSRPAYMAMSADGRAVIGVTLSDRMMDKVAADGGSFFRQYLLVGDGELPSAFRLHGKVERAAIGRMPDGSLYYIVSRGRETMYSFADALREYGFIDAIYITGGRKYTFHRLPDGQAVVDGELAEKLAETPPGSRLAAPMLVFRSGR